MAHFNYLDAYPNTDAEYMLKTWEGLKVGTTTMRSLLGLSGNASPIHRMRVYLSGFGISAVVVLLASLGACADRNETSNEPPGGPLAANEIERVPYSATVHGSAREVSGALSIVDLGDTRLMVDCGAYYPHGEGEAAARNARAARLNGTLPKGATDCEAVVWTHAHLDHIGRTPLLVRTGFRGPIHATEATAEIAPVMLRMQIRYEKERVRNWVWTRGAFLRRRRTVHVVPHWRHDCPYARKIRLDFKAGWMGSLDGLIRRLNSKDVRPVNVAPCKACADKEVDEVMGLVRAHGYHEPISLGSNAQMELLPAGHIPGSASVQITVEKDRVTRRLLFSGDLGNQMSRISAGPERSPKADMVFIETTYGTRRRPPEVREQFAEFRKDVAGVVEDGGIAWIPAFALDRTQKVLFELRTAQKQGVLATDIPIYCPSPSAARITGIYKHNREAGWFSEAVGSDATAFSPAGYHGKLPEGGLEGPAIVISTSGMMESAFSGTLAPLLQNPKNAVFLVGYQDPNAPGGALRAEEKLVTIDSRQHVVLARVLNFGCFSGHGDAADIDDWLSSQRDTTPVVLIHGECKSLEKRAKELSASRSGNVMIAEPGQPISIFEL